MTGHPTAPAPHPQVGALHDAAAQLRATAAALAATIDEIASHHRSDVWEGGVARRFGDELADHRRRLLHPRSGAVVQLGDAATRLAARAHALEANPCPPPTPPLLPSC